jgi:hypothetical protein
MSRLHALSGQGTTPPAGHSVGPDAVKDTLTPHRAGRVRENDEYAAFARCCPALKIPMKAALGLPMWGVR